MKFWTVITFLQVFEILKSEAWAPASSCYRPKKAFTLFSALPTAPDISLNILVSNGDEQSMSKAASFMVNSFWLGTGRLLIPVQDEQEVSVSDATRRILFDEQVFDLTAKYGERMGKRLLQSCLLAAFDSESGDILGMVGLETSLLDKSKEDILSPELAESTLKNAVASLGPKQRRQYKDSSVKEIAQELLPPDLQLICCLSNLAVSPSARRRGIAVKLCNEVERIASSEWEFDSLFLKVESENCAARYLYEQKLGYKLKYTIESATAIRIDLGAGCFVESEASTIILAKAITL